MNRFAARFIVTLLVVASVALVVAQQPDTDVPQPTFRTGVSLVRVDVTVSGRDDETVADLQASDFEIREDDVLQTIESFTFVRLDGQKAPGDDMSLDIRSRAHGEVEVARDDVRVFALFLDDYHVSDDLATNFRIREALEEWVEKTIKPTDIVVLMDPLTPISALEYSRSKADLIERIKKFKGREGVYLPVRSALEEGQLQTRNPRRLRAEVTLTALNAIVTHLGSLRERRTSVIFVSQGPPLRFADAQLEPQLRDVLEAANKFNVTINVVDPTGLTGNMSRDVLWRLSSETGGRAVLNTNGLAAGLMDVSRDASAYYLIGYSPTRAVADGKFHEIDVKVKRKGVRQLARRGYWAEPPAEMVPTRGPTAPAGVTRALGAFEQITVARRAATWVGYEPGAGGKTRVKVAWEPRRRDAREAGDTVGTLVMSAKRDGGEVLPEMRVSARPTLDARGAGGAQARFDVAPGELKLSLLAETPAGEIVDRWMETLEVPEFPSDALALATPWLVLARSAQEYRALVKADDDGTPTPLREFRRTERVIARTRLFGVDASAPVSISLLARTGGQLASLTATRSHSGRIDTEVPLASLAAGEYVLRMVAESSSDAPTEYLAFRVIP